MAVDTEPGSVLDLLRKASKPAAVVVAAAAVIATGVYFWRQNEQQEAMRAEQSLFQAQNALANGNRALAESDLQKLIQRSPKAPGAIQAAGQLATLRYEDGKFAEGVALARQALERAPDHMKAGLHALVAAGLEDDRKAAEAAEEYKKAAAASSFELDKQKYQADAARALMAAGNVAEAKRLWAELAENELSPLADEARVRLGELNAKAAGRS